MGSLPTGAKYRWYVKTAIFDSYLQGEPNVSRHVFHTYCVNNIKYARKTVVLRIF